MKDMTFDWRTQPLSEWDNLVERASNSFGDLINMGDPNLSRARNSGAKIPMWHGLTDNLISFESNIYYYTRVLDHFRANQVSGSHRQIQTGERQRLSGARRRDRRPLRNRSHAVHQRRAGGAGSERLALGLSRDVDGNRPP